MFLQIGITVCKEKTDLVYFDMQGKDIYVARYSCFQVIFVYNNPRRKDLVDAT